MKRALAILFLSLALTTQAPAQNSPAQTAPSKETKAEKVDVTVDQIIDKYIAAIGGKAAIQKVTSRVAKGTFEISAMGVSAPAELYSKAPNQTLLIVTIPGLGVIQQGYDGKVAWAQDPQTGLRELSDREFAAVKREADFYRELNFKQNYTKMVVLGKEKVGDKEAYVIEATPDIGSSEKFFFDIQSGLLIQAEREVDSPVGKAPVKVTFEDYKDVNGIKESFKSVQSLPAYSFTIKLTEVQHNVPIDDAKFKKPAAK